MPILFLAAFIGGLVLAVFAMLHGIEHLRTNRSRAPSPFFNLPSLAAFGVGFGAVGYPLSTRTVLPLWADFLLALAGGALGVSGMIVLLAKWALRGATTRSGLDPDEIQGQLAIVTREVSPSEPGTIAYESDGGRIECSARTIGSGRLLIGTEVVIDHLENGVAFVEEWSAVEARL